MQAWLYREWPWYVAGPLIGLFVPALLLVGNQVFGIPANLSHLCAAFAPGKLEFFRYDWRKVGLWNLVFLAGVLIGGFLAFHGGPPQTIAISADTRAALGRLGIHDFSGVAPHELFTWHAVLTLRGFVLGGCRWVSGGLRHSLRRRLHFGSRNQRTWPTLRFHRLIAVFGFFAGGLAATYFILPFVLGRL